MKAADIKYFPISQKCDDCCQICWQPTSRESHTYDDMPECDTCYRTYHWKCLIEMKACTHADRLAAEASEQWHFPARAPLTKTEKDHRKAYAEQQEMLQINWYPSWEPEELVQR